MTLAALRAAHNRQAPALRGRYDVAHTPLDLANPKANVKNHGFTPEERAGFQNFMDAGFVDTLILADVYGSDHCPVAIDLAP